MNDKLKPYIRQPDRDAWNLNSLLIWSETGIDLNIPVEIEKFEAGDIVEVYALDGRPLAIAIVTTVLAGGGLLALEYDDPHDFLYGRRNDIVSAVLCRKVKSAVK